MIVPDTENIHHRSGSPGPSCVRVLGWSRVMLRLNVELLRLFSTGVLPATALQRLAKAAWDDGWGRGDELAARLSRAGSAGGALRERPT